MEQYEKFGCCAFWKQCDNARNCRYQETVPNKMKACGVYRRIQRVGSQTIAPVVEQAPPLVLAVQEEIPPVKPHVDDLGQLSLF